jgi:murein DD-endopeptidase MepM/ murein hydrolase activator NlpD
MAFVPVSLAAGALAVTVLGVFATAPGSASPTASMPSPVLPPPSQARPAMSGLPPWPARVAPSRSAPLGHFRWPVHPAPTVLRRFAVGPRPWSPGHRGVDLAADAGQGVLAAGPGVVVFAGRVAGLAVVVVDHGRGLRTTYEPVNTAIPVGERTVAGTRIGTLGDWPGHCAASCLHWGAIRAGAYIDPLALLGLVPPVLLPLTARPSP